jgi:hypothetical protein
VFPITKSIGIFIRSFHFTQTLFFAPNNYIVKREFVSE